MPIMSIAVSRPLHDYIDALFQRGLIKSKSAFIEKCLDAQLDTNELSTAIPWKLKQLQVEKQELEQALVQHSRNEIDLETKKMQLEQKEKEINEAMLLHEKDDVYKELDRLVRAIIHKYGDLPVNEIVDEMKKTAAWDVVQNATVIISEDDIQRFVRAKKKEILK